MKVGGVREFGNRQNPNFSEGKRSKIKLER